MLSASPPKIHEPLVTGVSPRPTDQRQRQKLRNTRYRVGAENPDTASDQHDRCERSDLALTVVSTGSMISCRGLPRPSVPARDTHSLR